jgi:hypothetical protein
MRTVLRGLLDSLARNIPSGGVSPPRSARDAGLPSRGLANGRAALTGARDPGSIAHGDPGIAGIGVEYPRESEDTRSESMRVLVCGGRDNHDEEYVAKTLDRLLAARGPFERLIHGDARGVDRMAGKWARDHGVLEWDFLPEWHHVEHADGESRNQRMLAEGAPDLVVAFPGGVGTESMIELARAARIEVVEVPPAPKAHG